MILTIMLTKFLCKRVFYGNLVDITQMTMENADADSIVVIVCVVNIDVLGISTNIAYAVNRAAAQELGAANLVITADGSIIGTIKLSPIMALLAGRRIHLKYLSLKV
jgi:hypothetical protein